jgi:APA family basic amino acid/polyamine antiporter
MSIWKRKPLHLLRKKQQNPKRFKEDAFATGISCVCVGAIIGAGLFSITGLAAATNA